MAGSQPGRSRPKRSRSGPTSPGRALAPEQFLGFSLQTTRALARLLRCSAGESVAVELVDDVSVHKESGAVTAEQLKNVSKNNPLADRSVDLWKTLANWRTLYESLTPQQRELYAFELVVPPHFAPGPLASSLDEAKTQSAALAAVGTARDVLLGPSPTFPTLATASQALQPLLPVFFKEPLAHAAALVARLTIVSALDTSRGALEEEMWTKAVPRELASEATDGMLGWVKQELDARINDGLAPLLHVDAFLIQLSSLVRKLDNRIILSSFAPKPTQPQMQAELTTRTYIRQLQLIACDDTQQLAAADHYLRAATDRTIWATKGFVHPSSYDDFEEDLAGTWANKKRAGDITNAHQPEASRGQLLLSACLECSPPLEGRSVRPYFIAGCFHELAEQRRIGWHPQYETLLAAPTGP
jgi:hypothetical protein